jgi:hypothetical protein
MMTMIDDTGMSLAYTFLHFLFAHPGTYFLVAVVGGVLSSITAKCR